MVFISITEVSVSDQGRLGEGMARHAVKIAATLLLGFQATSGQFPLAGSQYSDRQDVFVLDTS